MLLAYNLKLSLFVRILGYLLMSKVIAFLGGSDPFDYVTVAAVVIALLIRIALDFM